MHTRHLEKYVKSVAATRFNTIGDLKNSFPTPRCLMLPVVILILFAICSGSVWAGEVDRLAVVVNGKVITEGDLDVARAINRIVFSDKNSGPRSRTDDIDHLIDLELMRQELENFNITQDDEAKVRARLHSIRDAYADKGGLPLLLNQLGLQESELIAYLQLESSIMKFVDFRFRAFSGVSEEEIKAYYETRLTPQLQKANLALPPIEQVSSRIEEILKEEKINSVLEQWLKEIRRISRIEYFDGTQDLRAQGVESSSR